MPSSRTSAISPSSIQLVPSNWLGWYWKMIRPTGPLLRVIPSRSRAISSPSNASHAATMPSLSTVSAR